MVNDGGEVFFRAGVGAVITNLSFDRVLLFRRGDYVNTWQCPQGGVNQNESTDEAVFREVFEETGIKKEELEVVAVCPVWLGYELPSGKSEEHLSVGQVHRWYVLKLLTSYDVFRDAAAKEFIDSSWRSFDDWNLDSVPSFKKEVVIFLMNWFFDVALAEERLLSGV
ncbi:MULTISPECIES: NUDIX domain-containing protein [Candidatus Ichthyocystis]|uniref:Putative RNA pyrophosphohydrolase n=1 Tax=Candidatus Ichthyocystis hellenicum TaxID=1561003 RepID=A0A0S4M2W2_9BURK|nr:MULTISPECIES: NUDIX domain-containing protein [Ichthyocystis]CUT17324.1 putative RNA pyrophosphohydrolase [Candidatus Ichthyocystis hellenicum]